MPEISIPLSDAATLAIECWRLNRTADVTSLRRSVRRIQAVLNRIGIQFQDMTGRPYDPGMVPEVIEVQEHQNTTEAIIQETISPTVFWKEQVIEPGQIIISKALDNE